jgi:hypothetical protein
MLTKSDGFNWNYNKMVFFIKSVILFIKKTLKTISKCFVEYIEENCPNFLNFKKKFQLNYLKVLVNIIT